jgi:hypothetical protein
MLTHLCANGATLDDVDVQELIRTIDSTWNPTENPATKFEHDNKIEQQLEKFSILLDPLNRLALMKAVIKCAGIFNAAICKWEANLKTNQTHVQANSANNWLWHCQQHQSH